jgi:hypothetical protein
VPDEPIEGAHLGGILGCHGSSLLSFAAPVGRRRRGGLV